MLAADVGVQGSILWYSAEEAHSSSPTMKRRDTASAPGDSPNLLQIVAHLVRGYNASSSANQVSNPHAVGD